MKDSVLQLRPEVFDAQVALKSTGGEEPAQVLTAPVGTEVPSGATTSLLEGWLLVGEDMDLSRLQSIFGGSSSTRPLPHPRPLRSASTLTRASPRATASRLRPPGPTTVVEGLAGRADRAVESDAALTTHWRSASSRLSCLAAVGAPVDSLTGLVTGTLEGVTSAPIVVHRPSLSGGRKVTVHRRGRDEIRYRLQRSRLGRVTRGRRSNRTRVLDDPQWVEWRGARPRVPRRLRSGGMPGNPCGESTPRRFLVPWCPSHAPRVGLERQQAVGPSWQDQRMLQRRRLAWRVWGAGRCAQRPQRGAWPHELAAVRDHFVYVPCRVIPPEHCRLRSHHAEGLSTAPCRRVTSRRHRLCVPAAARRLLGDGEQTRRDARQPGVRCASGPASGRETRGAGTYGFANLT